MKQLITTLVLGTSLIAFTATANPGGTEYRVLFQTISSDQNTVSTPNPNDRRTQAASHDCVATDNEAIGGDDTIDCSAELGDQLMVETIVETQPVEDYPKKK